MMNSMKIYKFIFQELFAFIVLFSGLSSQEITGNLHSFSGQIADTITNDPLPGVSVFLPATKLGTFSLTDGKFVINNIKTGKYQVIISQVGYESKSLVLEIKENVYKKILLKSSAVKLNDVNVISNRDNIAAKNSMQSISILNEDKIENSRGQSLGETLKDIPGITLLQTGSSISKPVIRGMHSERVVILNSGIAQEGQQWGGEHAPEIDPFMPSRIEVLRGASGVEYGIGAIGGVIKIEPKNFKENTGISGILNISTFSNNRQFAGSALLDGRQDFLPGFVWQARCSYRKAGSEKSADYIIGNTGFEEQDLNIRIGYNISNLNTEISFSHFGIDIGLYRGAHIGNLDDLKRAISYDKPPVNYDFTYTIANPKQEINHDTWYFKADYKIQDIGALNLIYSYQDNHRQEYDAHRRWFDTLSSDKTTPAFDLTLITNSIDLNFSHEPFDNFYGRMGLNGTYQQNTGNSLSYLIPNFTSYNAGFFILENWIMELLTLNTGFRYDLRRVRVYEYLPKNIPGSIKDYSNISFALGIFYELPRNWSLSSNLGTAFRPPSINELYSNGIHHGTAQYEIGDPNLKNEKSISIDLTLRRISDKFHFELSGYYNYIYNYIYLFPLPNPTLTLRGLFPTFKYEQSDASITGMDGYFEAILKRYTAGISFSLTRGNNTDKDEPLFQMPGDKYRIYVNYKPGNTELFRNNFFEVSSSVALKQTLFPENVDYLNPPNGYILFDISCKSSIEIFNTGLTINLNIKNIFNTAYRDYLSRYRYFVDNPGRDIIFKIQIPFGKQNNYQQ
jgi:iron complex outermembrane recepter protein